MRKESNPDYHLRTYLKEIKKYKLLTQEEEYYYSEKARKGDQEAIDKIVKANLRFVVSIIKDYYNPKIFSLNDLIGFGNIGLIEAAKKFKKTKEANFISYAVWRIKYSILEAVNSIDVKNGIYIPPRPKKILSQIKRIKIKLSEKLEHIPTNEEIIEELNKRRKRMLEEKIKAKENKKIIKKLKKEIKKKYDTNNELIKILLFCSDEEIPKTLMKKEIPDNESISASQNIEEVIKTEALLKILKKILLEKEFYIIKNHFGINTPEMSVKEISKTLNLSLSDTYRTKEKSLNILRKKSSLFSELI